MAYSAQDLSTVRLYRAFQTVIEMCEDRAYTITAPRAVVKALRERNEAAGTSPGASSSAACLSYPWFQRHFCLSSKESSARQAIAEEDGDDVGEASSDRHRMTIVCERSATATEVDVEGDVEASAAAEPATERLVAFFSSASTLNIKEVIEYRQRVTSRYDNVRNMIVVAVRVVPAVEREAKESCLCDYVLNDDATSRAQSLRRIELFEEKRLLFNPFHHDTVPKHVVLSPSEVDQLLQERQVKPSQIPRIEEGDPIVKYVGAQRGDILKIIREAKESGPYLTFRCVV